MKDINEIRAELRESARPDWGLPVDPIPPSRQLGGGDPPYQSAGGVTTSNIDWGWNRVTGVRIKCTCEATSYNRSLHQITCPVWMTRGIVTWLKPQGGPITLESERSHPCTNWAHTNCRIRSADKRTYCNNCLHLIGIDPEEVRIVIKSSSSNNHMGGVRD